MGTPRTVSRLAALATLIVVLGACDKAPTSIDAGREMARPSALHLGYAPSSNLHPFVGRVINIVTVLRVNGASQCLDVENGIAVSNQYVNHAPCMLSAARQRFYVDTAHWRSWRHNRALVTLRSEQDRSLCLDVENGTAFGGEWLQLYPCHHGRSQVFQLPPQFFPTTANFTQGPIFTEVSGFQMVLDAYLPFSSGWVQQYSLNWGANQQWFFRNALTGQVL